MPLTQLAQVKTLSIKPCILVTDKLTVHRAVSYGRTELSATVNADGSEDAKWETERHYKNKEESQEADRIYSRARSKLRSICLQTDIGFVCPASKEPELSDAIEEARFIVDEANKGFTHCSVNFRVVCTRIESDNDDGAATLKDALNSSVVDIRNALFAFDPKKARASLKSTSNLVDVLSNVNLRTELQSARDEASKLAGEMAKLLKEFDGNVKDAMASVAGKDVLARTDAAWNF